MKVKVDYGQYDKTKPHFLENVLRDLDTIPENSNKVYPYISAKKHKILAKVQNYFSIVEVELFINSLEKLKNEHFVVQFFNGWRDVAYQKSFITVNNLYIKELKLIRVTTTVPFKLLQVKYTNCVFESGKLLNAVKNPNSIGLEEYIKTENCLVLNS